MSYWKSAESNPVKIILVIVLLAVAGYFVYASAHRTALENTAQVRKNPGGGRGEGGTRCLDGAPTGTLVPALGPAFPVTTVVTSTQVGGRNQIRGAWTLKNPGECPLKLTDVSFIMNTNMPGVWPPMQNIRLFVGTAAFGATLPLPTPDTVACASSNPRCVLAFSDSSGYVINPGATARVRIISDTLNVPGTVPSGAGTWYSVQLSSFKALSTLTGGTFTWSGPAIVAGTINVIN